MGRLTRTPDPAPWVGRQHSGRQRSGLKAASPGSQGPKLGNPAAWGWDESPLMLSNCVTTFLCLDFLLCERAVIQKPPVSRTRGPRPRTAPVLLKHTDLFLMLVSGVSKLLGGKHLVRRAVLQQMCLWPSSPGASPVTSGLDPVQVRSSTRGQHNLVSEKMSPDC